MKTQKIVLAVLFIVLVIIPGRYAGAKEATDANMIVWGTNLSVDFGSDRGLYRFATSTGWAPMTSWGDAGKMIEWNFGTSINMVVDFGGGNGHGLWQYSDNGGWNNLSAWENVNRMIACGDDLVVDFGGGRGLWRHDGSNWQQMTSLGDISNMLEWDVGKTANLVVDFGNGHGLWLHDGSNWYKLSAWDSAAHIQAWNNGHKKKSYLLVDFGGGHGLWRYHAVNGWEKLSSWDDVSGMVTVGKKAMVDFGENRGIFFNTTNNWHKLTSWYDAMDMIEWNDGSNLNLVVDFGDGSRSLIFSSPRAYPPFPVKYGLYYHDATAWHQLSEWDDVAQMLEWDDGVAANRLVVDFGTGRGIYYYSGGWTQMAEWSTED